MEKKDSRGDIAKPFLSAGLLSSSSTLRCPLEVLYITLGFTSKGFTLLRPELSW